MNDAAIDLVRRFGGILDAGRLAEIDELLAPDCRDHNPLPFQGPGRAGVAFKLAWYRALQPAARTRLVHLDVAADVVLAEWITEHTGGGASRYRGRFTIAGDRIAAFEVDRVG